MSADWPGHLNKKVHEHARSADPLNKIWWPAIFETKQFHVELICFFRIFLLLRHLLICTDKLDLLHVSVGLSHC